MTYRFLGDGPGGNRRIDGDTRPAVRRYNQGRRRVAFWGRGTPGDRKRALFLVRTDAADRRSESWRPRPPAKSKRVSRDSAPHAAAAPTPTRAASSPSTERSGTLKIENHD